MKINDPMGSAISTAKLDQSQMIGTTGKNARTGASGEGGNDQVQLSNLASALRSQAGASPERTARVDQLAFQYQSGQYAVNAMELSSSMVGAAIRGF